MTIAREACKGRGKASVMPRPALHGVHGRLLQTFRYYHGRHHRRPAEHTRQHTFQLLETDVTRPKSQGGIDGIVCGRHCTTARQRAQRWMKHEGSMDATRVEADLPLEAMQTGGVADGLD